MMDPHPPIRCYIQYTTIQALPRIVREGLKSEGEPFHVAELRIPVNSTATVHSGPVAKQCLPDLDDIAIFRTRGSDGISRQLPSNYSRRAEWIVRSCGFDMSIYVNPPAVACP